MKKNVLFLFGAMVFVAMFVFNVQNSSLEEKVNLNGFNLFELSSLSVMAQTEGEEVDEINKAKLTRSLYCQPTKRYVIRCDSGEGKCKPEYQDLCY